MSMPPVFSRWVEEIGRSTWSIRVRKSRFRGVTIHLLSNLAIIAFFSGDMKDTAGQERAIELSERRFGSRAPVRDELTKFQIYVKNARQLRNENVVMQQRDFSCGAAALATVLVYYWGEDLSETAILLIIAKTLSREELEDRVRNGLTLTDLKRVAQIGGYTAVLGKLSIDSLRKSKLPLIVGITVNNYDHFVVYRGMDEEYVYLADPIFGKKRVKISDFAEQWQKNAILAVIKPGNKPRDDSPLRLQDHEKLSPLTSQAFIHRQLTGRINP